MSKIIFMGTPYFAVPTLESLHREFGLSAVVTAPDKPRSRGHKVLPTPVKEKAIELQLPVLQPESLRDADFQHILADMQPDIICVVAFRILPRAVFSVARLGTFNIHGSILPKYRGAAPINWAIIRGETESGVTSFLLNDGIDTGAIIGEKRCSIAPFTTAGELHDMLMPLAADLAVETCNALLNGTASPRPQDNTLASSAPKIFRDTCRIIWDKPAIQQCAFIHGFSPIPGAWTLWEGTTLKILQARPSESSLHLTDGTWCIANGEWLVATGAETISLQYIQPEGKKAMPVQDFLRGYRGQMQGMFL